MVATVGRLSVNVTCAAPPGPFSTLHAEVGFAETELLVPVMTVSIVIGFAPEERIHAFTVAVAVPAMVSLLSELLTALMDCVVVTVCGDALATSGLLADEVFTGLEPVQLAGGDTAGLPRPFPTSIDDGS
jgi:hypothetical protein